MADANQDVWQWVATGLLAVLSSVGLYKMQKIDDMPEKYVMKDEVQSMKKELREDLKTTKDELLNAINRIHERMDHRRITDCGGT